MEGRRKYLFRCDFSSCSESTEIWHADSFCVKKCPCVFFNKRGNEASNMLLKVHTTPSAPPPPPPSSSTVVKHTHAQCFCFQRSKSYNVWRRTQGERGGGVDFRVIWSLLFCLLKKNIGTFFNTKRIGMPNFSGFRATRNITTK